MKDRLLFLKQFMTNPGSIGAIAPSSGRLAKEIVKQAAVHKADLILEFGAGTGIFTKHIVDKKKMDAKFVAVERNPELVNILKKKFPALKFHADSIENISQILEVEKIEKKADSIVCGLPWAAFDRDLQHRLLNATHDILRPGGVFTTFAYLQGLLLPAGQRFKRNIEKCFSKVEKSPVVWRNLPPAFVYRCTK